MDDTAQPISVVAEPAAASGEAAKRGRHRLLFWRSPADQPSWARPVLLAIAAVAAWSYAWQSSRPVNIEIYYAAAVRSMSMSFSNFVFGAFDPAGTVTTDKLPGAFWVQAVAVRLLGVHNWVLVLPQVVEGTLTVLVLYRAVRGLAGPAAGILSAGLLAISPATVALDRGNVSDTLMILLAVLAADSAVTAVVTGRRRPILLAGLWVGLAFQAKMLEAWLVLPPIACCYLLAAPGQLPQRLRRAAAMIVLAAAVSLSWMTAVTLWPASARPYIDGSHDNSAFQQVFVYNGFGRLDQVSPDQLLNQTIRLGLPAPPPPGWDRLLTGALGRDTGWLLAAALVVLIAGLISRRTKPRGDLVRAGLVLWGTWLVLLAASFSVSTAINSYYTAALSPAVAALIGIGLVLGWRQRDRAMTGLTLAIALAVTAGYACWLLPSAGTGLPSWLRPAVIVLAVSAAASLALAAALRRRVLLTASVALPAVAALLVPAVASASVVASGLGPFQTPFESGQATAAAVRFFGAGFQAAQVLPGLEAVNRGTPYLMATQTSALAAPFIYASGREILPIGGFTGTIPEPTLTALKNLIALSDVHIFVQAPLTRDPRLTWIAAHCIHVPPAPGSHAILPVSIYYCGSFIFLPKHSSG
ncbi:MAG TPA: glycosyltransferase family 39 protein [Streptosporangiaceae bacterium]|nr:glycosyltransferase family 39 protein [Streptosporangiaceae bacterium]